MSFSRIDFTAWKSPVWILLALVTVLPATAQEAAAPVAQPVEPVADFEIVPKGQAIDHVFEIRNDGNAVLEITNVSPACGCTVAEFDKKIAPGEIGKIKTTVDTASFTGPISKSIAVYTNDPEKPRVQLVVKAVVKPFIGALPGYARYIYVQGENTEPVVQEIWTEDGSEMNITGINNPYDFVEVTHRELAEEERALDRSGSQFEVSIHLKENAPVGALANYVEILVDHPKQPIVKIPITGFVRPRQHVTPAEADFGAIEGNALPRKRTLTFTNFIETGIEVESIDTGLTGLLAEVQDVGKVAGHRFKLLLTVGENMPKGDFKTVVKIKTTDPSNPVVQFPVKGSVI